jgi:hypothetical protein
MICDKLNTELTPDLGKINNFSLRHVKLWVSILLTTIFCLIQVACGGGGSDSGNAPVPTAGAGGTSQTTTLKNFQSLIVETGPANLVNVLTTTVTICNPGDTTRCASIDHVLVDTGSTGLRILSSAIPAGLQLPQKTTVNGSALVECTQFADGYSWGPIKAADLKLGGETISSLSIQIIGDPNFRAVPSDCSSTGPSENTVADFGSNGVIGIGNFIADCGSGCATNTFNRFYYSCNATDCIPTALPVAQQLQHPVALLANHNNGVLLRLPTVPKEGAISAPGTMIFGIGTAPNNGLGNAGIYNLDSTTGTVPISVNGVFYPNSFIDSGSNAVFFSSPNTPVCASGFYCPASPFTSTFGIRGSNGTNTSTNFLVSNADTFFRLHPDFGVAPSLAGNAFGTQSVDLGLPFFFGRNVYTAIEGKTTPAGLGPYVAF